MGLVFQRYIELPNHTNGGFDHADAFEQTGDVFVAHTANGSIEVIKGETGSYVSTIHGCPEASGVLCAQQEALVFSASRGAGKILVIDAKNIAIQNEIKVGPKPNGLAWSPHSRQLLVADIEDFQARLIDPFDGRVTASSKLPGRPRWCTYDKNMNHFLVNIRDPPQVVTLDPSNLVQKKHFQISAKGPHGLDINQESGIAYVACDENMLVILDAKNGDEVSRIQISGEPDVVWYNPSIHHLYCAIGKPGILEVVDTDKMEMVERIPTEEGTHTLAFDQKQQRLYAFAPKNSRAIVFDEK